MSELAERQPALSIELERTIAEAKVRRTRSMSESTLRAYRSDLADFAAYCKTYPGTPEPLPATPQVIAHYLTWLDIREERSERCVDTMGRERLRTIKPLKVTSILRHWMAIATAHRKAQIHPNPAHDDLVKDVVDGMQRMHADSARGRKRKVAPITEDLLAQLLKPLAVEVETSLSVLEKRRRLRDRALVLVGFAGGFRRSELVAVCIEDLAPTRRGYLIAIPKSKTDQTGKGLRKTISEIAHQRHICPVTALRAWLADARITAGPVFRSLTRHGTLRTRALAASNVAGILQDLALRSGIVGDIAGHSLRSGFITSADSAGVRLARIMEQTGHRSVETALGYVQRELVDSDPLLSIFPDRNVAGSP